MNKNKYLIVYHLEDNDGVCSAAIIKYYLLNNLHASHVDLFPATYAILDNVVKHNFMEFEGYDSLIMTDVSFNGFENMEHVFEMFGKNFVWIDHHAPIIKESEIRKYDIKINGVRDSSRSAILNAYKYCFDEFDIKYNSGTAPLIFRYLSARDSWSTNRENLDFEKTRAVNAGFTSISKISVDWFFERIGRIIDPEDYRYNDEVIEEMYSVGKKIVDEADRRSEELVKNCGQGGYTVNGRSAILLFTSGPTNSLIFKTVKDKYQNAICVKSSNDGRVILSLYNTGFDDHSFHCGEYLKKTYGGGGHEGAAGCTISKEVFVEHFLKSKF